VCLNGPVLDAQAIFNYPAVFCYAWYLLTTRIFAVRARVLRALDPTQLESKMARLMSYFQE
jgi:hypothetical protein